MEAAKLFRRYVRWLEKNVPAAFDNLAGPAPGHGLIDLEILLGRSLPPEVAEVLSIHDGQKVTATFDHNVQAVPCLPGMSFLSTAEIGRIWEQWHQFRTRTKPTSIPPPPGGVAPQRVREIETSPGWIPLWADPAKADYIGLDFDPADGGTPGQVISFGREENRHVLCAENFTELLTILVEEAESGIWSDEPLGAWKRNARSSFLDIFHERSERRYRRSMRVGPPRN